MPPLTDQNEIREILETDRAWSAYALADLEPGFFEHTAWFSSTPNSLVLVYSAFRVPVLLAVGARDDLATAWDEATSLFPSERDVYIAVRPDVLPLVERSCRVIDLRPMLRMVLNSERFRPVDADHADRLRASDLPELAALYADGTARGESPEFFAPQMVEQGVYFGIREGAYLVAAGGTHVLSVQESVAGLGNIYTRRDCRGRGLGTRVTSALTAHLLKEMKLRTIALNVRQTNAPAIRVYERLGFESYCPYYEMVAVKRS